MQHEMALSGLTDVNLDKILPKPDPATHCMKSRQSLLRKMTSLQLSLRSKKIMG